MLNELQNLVLTEKEIKLQAFIGQLTYDLYNSEKIEVDSKKLLELLRYLTSNENISTQMKSAVEYQHSRIVDILHKKEVELLEKHIKYLEEDSIPVQKVKDKIEDLKRQRRELGFKTYLKREDMLNDDRAIVREISVLEELLEENNK